jgi:putative chitinase
LAKSGSLPRKVRAVRSAIDLIDAQLLKVAAPETPIQQLAQWADPLKLGCHKFGIDGVRPIAALLAQCAHESYGFTKLAENLNYTAQRLCVVWPRRFPNIAAAAPYARNPKRWRTSPMRTGWATARLKAATAGAIAATACSSSPGTITTPNSRTISGMPLADVAAYLRTVNGAAMSACWFFQKHGLIDLAKTPGVADETRAVNGGLEGLRDRERRFDATVAEMLRRGA